MRRDARRPLLALVVLSLGLGGCTEMEDGMAAVPFLNFMREAPFFDPYEAPRPAPPNAVPVESPLGDRWEPVLPTPVSESALRAFGDTLTNPLAGDAAALERGQEVYLTYCSVCHGPQGSGDGPIVGQGRFPMATNLTLPATVNRTDGYLYAIIRSGRGLMPPYQRIPQRDRWAVVNYVRQLQQVDAAPDAGREGPSPATPDAGGGAADTAGGGAADTGAATSGGRE